MPDISPFSPEERGLHGEEGIGLKPEDVPVGFKRLTYAWLIVKRVVLGVLSDGFIHAGNLAYLALLTVFPFFILAAVIASLLGQSAETQRAVASFLHVLPPSAWLGGVVALWSVGSFVETIRDIFRRAYGVKSSKPFWHYRLSSMAVILVSVILAVFSFLVQGILVAAEQFIYTLLPFAQDLAGWIGLSRLIPGFVMFLALFMLFVAVTPSKYRFGGKSPEWPGALFTTAWWLSITALLPIVLSRLADYDLTYGSLAGVIITLLFFFLVGLGIVFGAHLNAALAEPLQPGVETPHTDAATGTLQA
jgi:membrane protein